MAAAWFGCRSSRFWLWTAPVTIGALAAVVLGAGLVLALRGAAGDPIGDPAPPVRAAAPTPPPGGVRRVLVIGDSLARGTGDESGRGFAGVRRSRGCARRARPTS